MKRDLKTITIFFRASHALEQVIKDEVLSHGLSLSEFGVLEALYHKGPLNVNQVISKVLIPNSSMSYVIDQLVSKGLITKTKDAIDKRVYRLDLKTAGRDFMDQMYPIHEQRLRQVLDRMTVEEEKTLQTLLKKIGKK
jgi:MarR family 2-MHQ and catechol resistance regulon transcriptional repressor